MDDDGRDIEIRMALLEKNLKAKKSRYILQTGGTQPTLQVIQADPEWRTEFKELKALERLAAGTARTGGCSFYQARRRRFCLSRARDGGVMCTLHRSYESVKVEAVDAALSRAIREKERKVVVTDSSSSTNTTSTSNVHSAASTKKMSSKDSTSKKRTRTKTNVNRRMKRMTNPLAAQFQTPKVLDNEYWTKAYGGIEHLTLPLLVDIGSAKGGFIKGLAREHAEECTLEKNGLVYNLLGIEIFEILVDAANAWVQANKATLHRRAHFVACNVNVSLKTLNLPNIRAICVQFPDPWSRAKHAERRVMTPAFVQMLADVLPEDGEIFCCSDVASLAEEMYDVVLANDAFELDEATYERLGLDDLIPPVVAAAAAATSSSSSTADDDVVVVQPPQFDAAHKFAWEKNPTLSENEVVKEKKKVVVDSQPQRHHRRWLSRNPYAACATERDIVCEVKWRPVYRFAARRRRKKKITQ